jgi:ABC-type glycerol-3-phosphate transport system permease component
MTAATASRLEGQQRPRRRPSISRAVLSIVAIALAFTYLLPLLWVLSVSIRVQTDVFQSILIPNSFQPTNYPDAVEEFGLGVLFLNSLVITVGTVVLGVALSVSAAYGFVRFRSRWSDALFVVILFGLMVPPAAVIIPFFLGMLNLGLYDSLVAVIIGETAFVLGFGILVFRGYIEHIPHELIDAATVDGASDWMTFRRIVVPLLRPPLATVGIFFALSTWNGFILPLVLIRDTKDSTLPVGMAQFTGVYAGSNWNLLAAASVIAILPLLVIFVAARRSYVRGLSAGAIKE